MCLSVEVIVILYCMGKNKKEVIGLFVSKVLAIKEQIGYPDHILEENNQKLDEEYAHVSTNRDVIISNHR